MSMLRDADFLAKVEAAVGAAESKTDAEIVVALAPASGSYRDVEHRFAAVVAFAVLAFVVFAPWVDVGRSWFILDGLIAYVVALGLASRAPVRRVLTSRRRRRSQVARAARLAFAEEHVHATQRRTGVLLYVSVFERLAEVIPDLGIEGKVEGARFFEIAHDAAARGCSADAVLDAVAKIGDALAGPLPPTPGSKNEIPDRPRVIEE